MKVVKRIIVVNLQVEGLHKWQDAANKCPQSDFLSFPHRHMFHIHAEKEVNHNDRDVEFIVLKREISQYLLMNYEFNDDDRQSMLNFDGMSCEMIAEELAHKFKLSKCIVLEDGENGGGVICQD